MRENGKNVKFIVSMRNQPSYRITRIQFNQGGNRRTYFIVIVCINGLYSLVCMKTLQCQPGLRYPVDLHDLTNFTHFSILLKKLIYFSNLFCFDFDQEILHEKFDFKRILYLDVQIKNGFKPFLKPFLNLNPDPTRSGSV